MGASVVGGGNRATIAPWRRAAAYRAGPDPTFATQVSAKTSHTFMRPRPDRNAPSATATAAGPGGKMFSRAANAAIIAESGPGGSISRNARESLGGPTALQSPASSYARQAVRPP